MANQDAEQRRETRISVKGARVQFKPTGGIFAFLKGASEELPVVNVSLRGLKFISRQKLAEDTSLTFNIEIPMLGAEPLKADGRVVWVEKSHRYGGYIIGVRFTAMTRDAIKRLENLVAFVGSRVKVRQKVKVTFPEGLTQQPTLWHIARDYDVTVNVREGLVTDKTGWMILEIEGDREEVRRVLGYLKQKGAKLAFPKRV